MSDNNNVLLSMKHITKKFGKLTVLDDMSRCHCEPFEQLQHIAEDKSQDNRDD